MCLFPDNALSMPTTLPQAQGALTTHQVEMMKEHAAWDDGYNERIPTIKESANDFGPAVVRKNLTYSIY